MYSFNQRLKFILLRIGNFLNRCKMKKGLKAVIDEANWRKNMPNPESVQEDDK